MNQSSRSRHHTRSRVLSPVSLVFALAMISAVWLSLGTTYRQLAVALMVFGAAGLIARSLPSPGAKSMVIAAGAFFLMGAAFLAVGVGVLSGRLRLTYLDAVGGQVLWAVVAVATGVALVVCAQASMRLSRNAMVRPPRPKPR